MQKSKLLAGAALCALAVSACGSSSSSSSGATSGSQSSSPQSASSAAPGNFVSPSVASAFTEITGLKPLTAPATMAELTSRVAKYEQVPKQLLETKPVSVKATPGKNIALLVCGVPVCAEFNKAASQAASLLGWKVTRIDLGVSPQDFANAYNRAVQLKPDMVVGSGLPRSLFEKQLNELQQMNIPVIEWSSGIKPVPGHLWVATDDPLYQSAGIMTAEFLAKEGQLKANVVIANVPQYTMSTLYADTLKSYLPQICPQCKVDYHVAAVTDIGKLGPTMTGYVQQHPDTKYVVCTFGDLCQGVGQALKAAGRGDVKVFTRDPGTTNYQNIQNGLEWATNPLPIGQTGWQIIDLAQRIFNGDDTSQTRLAPEQIVTQISDPSSPLIGAVPDYEAQYKALWKLTG